MTLSSSRNFGAAASDYANFRLGFPDSLFDRLFAMGAVGAGDCVVDVGAGTGALARGFARRGCRTIAIDPDSRMLDQAARLASEATLSLDCRVGAAEMMPVADASADVVCAGQSWHWFQPAAAASEFARVARPGGRVIIAHFDWLPLPGSVVEATEELIRAHSPGWRTTGDGFHLESLPFLRAAGIADFESFSYEHDARYTPEAWRGRIRASAGIGATLTADAIAAFDAAHAAMLAARFPGEVIHAPHQVFALVGRKR